MCPGSRRPAVTLDERSGVCDRPGVAGENQVGVNSGHHFCAVDVAFFENAAVPGHDRFVTVLRGVSGIAIDVVPGKQNFPAVNEAVHAEGEFGLTITPRREFALIAVQGPNARAKVWQALPSVKAGTPVEEFESWIAQDELITLIESPNPFGIPVKIRGTLLPVLEKWKDKLPA